MRYLKYLGFKTKRDLPFSQESLLRVTRILEIGLRAGKDWQSILRWVSETDPDAKVQKYFFKFQAQIKIDLPEKILRIERESYDDKLWKIFTEILSQYQRGSPALAPLFATFGVTAEAIFKLKRQQQALLFVPRFQAVIGLLVAFVFAVILPVTVPEFFPTFISLGRPGLFVAGLSPLALGVVLIFWMCSRPQRRMAPMLSTSFFFYFTALYLDAGVDLLSSWRKALKIAGLPPELAKEIEKSGQSFDTLEKFLQKLQDQLPAPWPETLSGLVWVKSSGHGVADYLKDSSKREVERMLHLWEDEIRKLSFLTLLPLATLILLPTLYLLIGPQLLTLNFS